MRPLAFSSAPATFKSVAHAVAIISARSMAIAEMIATGSKSFRNIEREEN